MFVFKMGNCRRLLSWKGVESLISQWSIFCTDEGGYIFGSHKKRRFIFSSFLSALLPAGDTVLSGCSTLSLLTGTLQQLNRVFELYLGPWGPGQTGFVALPSHPADSPIIHQLQFLFDVLQKTLSLKVLGGARGQDMQRALGDGGGRG